MASALQNVEFKILNPKLIERGWLPERATGGAAGYDLRSCEDVAVTLHPQQSYKFRLGFAIHISDPQIAALIMPRSGLGSRGLCLANTIGLIDSDYTGEISTVARNWLPEGGDSITIEPGHRIFQLVLVPVIAANFVMVDEFTTASDRGEGGYGSTGT